jgi:hypothetical protein
MQPQKKNWLFNSQQQQPAKPQIEEIRSSVRFPLSLPVKVESADHRWLDATTQDISAGGFLFRSAEEFHPDTQFSFAIQMPAAIMGTPTDVVVHGSARVVRSYKKEPMNFTAAVIDDYSFEAALESHGHFKH